MVFNFNDEEVIITYDGLQIVIQEDKAKELANAILDRLLHHSHIININGNSYRLKDKIDSNVTEQEEDK